MWEVDQLKRVFQEPVLAAVVGTAITRPRDITRRFVQAIGECRGNAFGKTAFEDFATERLL